MKIKQLTEDFAVADQLTADDVDALAAAGYRTIICNRPDGEAADQPLRAEVEAVAQEHGMGFRYIPVVSGQMTMNDIAEFSAALDEVDAPVVAFCRSGTRSIQLWGLARGLKGMDPDEIVRVGAEAGYDLRGVAGWLTEQADQE